MNDLDPNELVTTIVHQAHVIRRLELALASQAQRNALLEAQINELTPDTPEETP